jgi:hypothetical protein
MIKCHYCGKENADDTQACPGCGTPLLHGPEPAPGRPQPGRPPSVGSIVECAVGVAGLLAGHVSGLAHLAQGLSDLDAAQHPDSPHTLLERAALLESVDMRAALALYEQIVLHHPGTTAAKEATQTLKTLRAAHPSLPQGS